MRILVSLESLLPANAECTHQSWRVCVFVCDNIQFIAQMNGKTKRRFLLFCLFASPTGPGMQICTICELHIRKSHFGLAVGRSGNGNIYIYYIYAQWTGWIAIALGGYLSYINAVYRVRMWPVDIHLEDITSQFEWLATKHAFLIARKNSHLHTEQFIRIRLICG